MSEIDIKASLLVSEDSERTPHRILLRNGNDCFYIPVGMRTCDRLLQFFKKTEKKSKGESHEEY